MPDRLTESIDGVEHFACGTCDQLKPRSAYHMGMNVKGAPPPHCKACDRRLASERNHAKLKQASRRRKQASAEIPPPPPELEVPPARVAQGKRLACPHCHETALREPANGRPGCTTWLVTCAYCDLLNQLVEVAADGSARSIPRRAVDEPGTRRDALPLGSGESFTNTNSAVFRPCCKVKGCGARAEEYGLCSPHLSRCRLAKRLGDVDAWVAEVAPPAPAPAASKAVKRKPKVAKKKAPRPEPPRPASGPCHVVNCDRPANHLGKQLCKACYEFWRRRSKVHSDFEAFLLQPVTARRPGRKKKAPSTKPACAGRNPLRIDEPCSARGCREPRLDRVPLCRKHEQRWVSSGRPEIEAWLVAGALRAKDWLAMHKTEILPPDDLPAQVCKVIRCYRAAQCCSQSLCNACYQRWVWAEKPNLDFFFGIAPPRQHQERHVRLCRASGCSRAAHSKESLCSMHQQRWNQCHRPHFDVWIAAGALSPTRWREHLAAVAAELAGEAKCS